MIAEKTQPNIFHIHIDATNFPVELENFAIQELGFVNTDFGGHPEGYVHFEPQRHLTLKLNTKQEFTRTWERLERKADECPDYVGYLEGEFIPSDEFIPYKPYQDEPMPFKVERRTLHSSKNEHFRQTEFHLTMEKSKTSPILIKRLLDSGLYGAYIPKPDGEFLVLTTQGFIKDILPLYEVLKNHLLKVGGAYRCTLKEERAIKFKMYGIKPENLPEIADKISYFEN
jgi:hypothetical protein